MTAQWRSGRLLMGSRFSPAPDGEPASPWALMGARFSPGPARRCAASLAEPRHPPRWFFTLSPSVAWWPLLCQ